MINSRVIRMLCMVLAVFYGQMAFSLTVNGDIEGNPPTDATYSGDDGILSSPGGIVWNSVPHFTNSPGLRDEFGNPTGIGVSWTGLNFGPTTDSSATNSLQDSGTWGSGFDIIGLNPGLSYDLAIYATENSGGRVTDAVSSSWEFWTIAGPPTYTMPGVAGQDYALYTGMIPFDLGEGIYGIQLSNFDGAVTGFQISAVPVPAAIWLFGSGLLGIIGLYKRKQSA